MARVFEDVLSGAKAARRDPKAALGYMRDDDMLVVTRLNRLGRTAPDTLHTIAMLAQQDAAVIALKPKVSTRSKESKLMAVMSGLAKFERDLLIEHAKEGLARAEGRVVDPKPKLGPEQVRMARKSIAGGESVAAVARSPNVSRQTLYRALERNE